MNRIGFRAVLVCAVLLTGASCKKEDQQIVSPIQKVQKGGTVETLTSTNFDQHVAGLAIVDFYADWCGPCKVLAPEFEQWAKKYPHATFGKVNIDHYRDLSVKYKVNLLPTVIVFRNGVETRRWVGIPQESEVQQALAK